MIFNKDAISSNYQWFKDKLSEEFVLDTAGKSKVIFGFNGIGKTTFLQL